MVKTFGILRPKQVLSPNRNDAPTAELATEQVHGDGIMGASNSSIPVTVIPVDCCQNRESNTSILVQRPGKGGISLQTPRGAEGVSRVSHAGWSPDPSSAFTSRLKPLDLDSKPLDPQACKQRRKSPPQETPCLLAEREELRMQAPATMMWSAQENFKQASMFEEKSSPVSSIVHLETDYGHFRRGEWQRSPSWERSPSNAASDVTETQMLDLLSSPRQEQFSNTNGFSPRRHNVKLLKMWVDGYLVSSPAERVIFEAKLRGVREITHKLTYV